MKVIIYYLLMVWVGLYFLYLLNVYYGRNILGNWMGSREATDEDMRNFRLAGLTVLLIGFYTCMYLLKRL